MPPFQRSKRIKAKPSLPDGVRIYAMADIHGRADLLDQMFTVIDADLAQGRPRHVIQVFLGDYIDRGPDSRKVLDLLIDRGSRHPTVFLKGNHEAYLMEVLRNPPLIDEWRKYGGLPTLMSYGLRPNLNPDAAEQAELSQALAEAMPPAHHQFLGDLRLSFSCGDFFFAHAGVRPNVPLVDQKEEDLLWIREEFLQCEDDFGKYVIHGHTPVIAPDIRPNRINIDTGAYATGNLTLLSIQGDSMIAI